jgi:hypothetical protein
MVTTTETATGFDLALSDEQQLVQRTARDFAREKVLPRAREIDERGKVPPELIAEMAALGFLGIYVPEAYGGAGLDALSYALVGEEINRACASTGVVMSSHVSLVVDPLLHYGTDAQKDRFLRPLAGGLKLGCFALSEPASGSDAAAMRTSARRDGDAWVLTGTKNFITNGASADIAIVFAQADPAARHRGIAAFVVEKGTPGFSVGKLSTSSASAVRTPRSSSSRNAVFPRRTCSARPMRGSRSPSPRWTAGASASPRRPSASRARASRTHSRTRGSARRSERRSSSSRRSSGSSPTWPPRSTLLAFSSGGPRR